MICETCSSKMRCLLTSWYCETCDPKDSKTTAADKPEWTTVFTSQAGIKSLELGEMVTVTSKSVFNYLIELEVRTEFLEEVGEEHNDLYSIYRFKHYEDQDWIWIKDHS